jgi:hypothetical protein
MDHVGAEFASMSIRDSADAALAFNEPWADTCMHWSPVSASSIPCKNIVWMIMEIKSALGVSELRTKSRLVFQGK